jgi:hypothetical protein
MGAAFLSVNLVVVTLFYQKAESLSFFYLRNLLYLIQMDDSWPDDTVKTGDPLSPKILRRNNPPEKSGGLFIWRLCLSHGS